MKTERHIHSTQTHTSSRKTTREDMQKAKLVFVDEYENKLLRVIDSLDAYSRGDLQGAIEAILMDLWDKEIADAGK
jgi:hypothetical protein